MVEARVQFNELGFKLSSIKKNHDQVDLYCSSEAAECLIGELNLPYTNVYLSHDKMVLIDDRLWALPKILTYSMQNMPFLIPQYNFGKVRPGQQVLLKFPAYPYQEFGTLKGVVEFISTTPSDSGYLAKVSLPNGLVTNYKKQLRYNTGLSAQADIITEDMNLLQRLFNNLRKNISQ